MRSDSSSRRIPSSSETSGRQPSDRTRSVAMRVITRPGGGSTSSISSCGAPVSSHASRATSASATAWPSEPMLNAPSSPDSSTSRIARTTSPIQQNVRASPRKTGIGSRASAWRSIVGTAPLAWPASTPGPYGFASRRIVSPAGAHSSAACSPELRQRVEALRRRRRVCSSASTAGRRRPSSRRTRGARRARRPRGRRASSRARSSATRARAPRRNARRRSAPPRGRPRPACLGDRRLRDALLREVAVLPPERVDLVGSVRVTKLVVKGATDEPGSPREQHLHRRRVYWRACALLAVVVLVGCDHGKRRAEPQPPPGRSSPSSPSTASTSAWCATTNPSARP